VVDAKTYLRIDSALEDATILTMISAATAILEKYADTKFVKSTWIEYHDRFPSNNNSEWFDGVREMPISFINSVSRYIRLSQGPVSDVVFSTYADDGVAQVFNDSSYVVDQTGDFGRIALKLGGVWPTTILRNVAGISIEYKAGLADAANGVPDTIKQAILETVGRLYEHRGDEEATSIPSIALTLIEPYRRFKMLC